MIKIMNIGPDDLKKLKDDESIAYKHYSVGMIISLILSVGVIVITCTILLTFADKIKRLIGELNDCTEIFVGIIIGLAAIIVLTAVPLICRVYVKERERDYEMKRNLYLHSLRK